MTDELLDAKNPKIIRRISFVSHEAFVLARIGQVSYSRRCAFHAAWPRTSTDLRL